MMIRGISDVAAAFIMGWIGTGCPVRHRLNHGFVIVFVIDRKVQYFIFKRNTPQLAAAGIKGMRIQFRLRSAWPGSNFMRQRLGCPAACGVGALPPFDMKMGLTHTYAAAISEVHVLTTSYPAFSSNLIIDRSFLFVARSLASSAPVS